MANLECPEIRPFSISPSTKIHRILIGYTQNYRFCFLKIRSGMLLMTHMMGPHWIGT